MTSERPRRMTAMIGAVSRVAPTSVVCGPSRFEAVYPTLISETDPPLLLTHEPLDTVPADYFNIHGHLHGAAGVPWSARHLNANVEQTNYRDITECCGSEA